MVFLLHLTNVRWLPCLCLNILSTGLTPASCFLFRNQRCLVLSSLKYFFILLTFTHCFYFICKDTQLSVRITGMTIFDDSSMFHFFTNLKHHKYVKCFNLIWIQSISFCHKLKGKKYQLVPSFLWKLMFFFLQSFILYFGLIYWDSATFLKKFKVLTMVYERPPWSEPSVASLLPHSPPLIPL